MFPVPRATSSVHEIHTWGLALPLFVCLESDPESETESESESELESVLESELSLLSLSWTTAGLFVSSTVCTHLSAASANALVTAEEGRCQVLAQGAGGAQWEPKAGVSHTALNTAWGAAAKVCTTRPGQRHH